MCCSACRLSKTIECELQRVAMCCNVLQCVAMSCNVLQRLQAFEDERV